MTIKNSGWKALVALLSLTILILLITLVGETYYLSRITAAEPVENNWNDSVVVKGPRPISHSAIQGSYKNDDDDDWTPVMIQNGAMFGTENPLSQINRMQRQMDELFNKASLPDDGAASFSMSDLNLEEDADHYTVRMTLPSSDKSKIKVKLNGRVLMVTGEQEFSKETNNKDDSVNAEESTAEFSESMELPGDVKADLMRVKVNKNILTITLPKGK